MFDEQRAILRNNIPVEVALIYLAVAVIAAGLAIWGYRTAGRRGEDILRYSAAGLCGLGLVVAGYIAWKALIVNEPFQCAGGGGGCAVVEKSKYARPFWDIHLSIWGLIGYAMILGATIWKGDNARLLAFGLSLFGFAVSLVLRYLELWEILATCQWCVASAVLMTMLLVLTTCRLIGYYGTDDPDGNPEPFGDDPDRQASREIADSGDAAGNPAS